MEDDASFLDTNGWMALLNSDDRPHSAVVQVFREFARRGRVIVVTDWIVAGTGNGLARTGLRDAFVRAVRLLSTSSDFRLIPIDDDLSMRAVDLDQGRADKACGLVDCASFVVMEREGIRDAITADRHFEQAGSRCLMSASGGNGKVG